MQTLRVFLLLAVVGMACSGVLAEDPNEPHSLVKRKINCPPKAICLPATSPPPPFRHRRSENLAADEELYELMTNPITETLSGHRQKRGSKPVPIIACNRKTGKCRRI